MCSRRAIDAPVTPHTCQVQTFQGHDEQGASFLLLAALALLLLGLIWSAHDLQLLRHRRGSKFQADRIVLADAEAPQASMLVEGLAMKAEALLLWLQIEQDNAAVADACWSALAHAEHWDGLAPLALSYSLQGGRRNQLLADAKRLRASLFVRLQRLLDEYGRSIRSRAFTLRRARRRTRSVNKEERVIVWAAMGKRACILHGTVEAHLVA